MCRIMLDVCAGDRHLVSQSRMQVVGEEIHYGRKFGCQVKDNLSAVKIEVCNNIAVELCEMFAVYEGLPSLCFFWQSHASLMTYSM